MPASDPGSSAAAAKSPVFEAHTHGQSIWLDNISRDLLLSGELRHWVEQEGIRGVTSNPAIFEKAIAQSTDYDPAARALIAQGADDALEVFERLAVQDIQLGCDVLRPIWEESDGRDGFVSLEVSPHLADDTQGTILEARRLAGAVSRENLMIKVPATPAGIPAIQQLIDDGIHVNVTLLFAVEAYEAVHQAYLAGLEARLARGDSVSGIASVASFFVSRIDAAIGKQIAAALEDEADEAKRSRLQALDAKVAIANAKLAYARFLETLASDRWSRLAEAGADPQRVLWASTGTKDPALPKTLYVDELIGQHTVNTLPDATLTAFREEGQARDALGKDPMRLEREANAVLSELPALGLSLEAVTGELLEKGCALFQDAFDALLLSVETKRQLLLGNRLSRTRAALDTAEADVEIARADWQRRGGTHALWRGDSSLFSSADESQWLGWLRLPSASEEVAIGPAALRHAIREHPADQVVVIGMGGSSLWPDVLGRALAGNEEEGRRTRRLSVLDTTVPEAIEQQISELDLSRCLFFVSSKSGTTVEPNTTFELLYARLAEQVGTEGAGSHFIAITDAGSPLAQRAAQLGFLGTALGPADVGGRFSALSPFGLLPAEAMGLDPDALRSRARRMAAACAPFVAPSLNPGVDLGLTLGTLARQGLDKLTLTTSLEIEAFTDWVEQLIAESTGKLGRGLVPITGEKLREPDQYTKDRIFVDIATLDDSARSDREARLAKLGAAGHPVIRIEIAEALDLAQEVFRWEVATTIVGALLELNPFDQPDVESAKATSRSLLDEMQAGGALAEPGRPLAAQGARLFSPKTIPAAPEIGSPQQVLSALLATIAAGDTFVINAFLADVPGIRGPLEAIREYVGRTHRIATALNFGPRYLHSTGQLQKGGPDRLVGLHLWQDPSGKAQPALRIPGTNGDFDTLAAAQALGDFQVLSERGRRVLGVDVGAEIETTLQNIEAWVRGTGG